MINGNNDNERFKVLIVDDDTSNLNILNHILKPQYKVYVAKSGEQAIKRAHEDLPDLILLDVLMPDKDGYEVLIELKNSDQTRMIPVIFITGLIGVENEEKGFFLGAVDYITKPFNNSIVLARVRTHLQIVRQIRTIERLCMIDALTDIPNRRSFDDGMDLEWNRSIRERMPISLLFIDVDHFKAYNDTYGHPQGDILLQTLAREIQSTLRRVTDRVFRYGGEEFTVILPNTSYPAAPNVAEGIRGNVAQTKIASVNTGEVTNITVSIGVASALPKVGDKLSEFIQIADDAMYESKTAGRNRVSARVMKSQMI